MEDVNTSDIIHQVELVEKRILKFRKDISNKNVIACVGNTRSGKSTLINFLQDNELSSFSHGKRFLIKSESSNFGPCVRHGTISHTKFPLFWPLKSDADSVIVDFPGFDDNRGIVRDIINAVFMNQLIYASSVRFVVVADIESVINDNVKEFTELMTNLESIVIDFRAVSLIFTKDSDNATVENVCSLMQSKILDVDELSVKKDLINHLVENSRQIGILKAPIRAGSIDLDEIECNVKNAMSSISSTKEHFRFTPSVRTKVILYDTYLKCLEEMNFQTEANSLLGQFDNYFNIDKYVFASTDQELESITTSLTNLLERIQTQSRLVFTLMTGLYESISTLMQRLSRLFEQRLKFLKFMEEVSLLDNNIRQIVIARYVQLLSDMELKITGLLEKINVEIQSRLKEGLEQLKSGIISDARKVIASSMVYIPLIKQGLEICGHNVEWLSVELAEVSGATFGIAIIGATSFGAGAYATQYLNTTRLRQKLRRQQNRV